MHSPNITIIGAGNMGTSLLRGLLKNNYSSHQLGITDPDTNKLNPLHQQFKVRVTNNNIEGAQKAHVIILAVKPQIINQVLTEISSLIKKNKPLIVSIAAGITVNTLQHTLGDDIPIVRAMPNTPTLIGCGASALFANSIVTHEQHSLAESILRAVGITVWLQDETLMDIVTALSGSGPAYFFLVIEALQHAAVKLGLSQDIATLLTQQTAYGAARMALESNETIEKLRHNVTSPGGTTEAALHILEEADIKNIFFQTLNAATKRSRELGAK